MRSDCSIAPAAESDVLIIALTSYGGHAHAADGFEWTRILSIAKCHKIFLRDSMQHWYQGGLLSFSANRDQTIDKIAQYIAVNKITRVMTIGSSMGAYGCLSIGGLLKAELAIAFAPQTNMNLAWMEAVGDLRWEWKAREMAAIGFPDLDLAQQYQQGQAPRCAKLFYSSNYAMDALHAQNLQTSPGVELIPLESGEHEVAYAMAKAGAVTRMVSDFVGENLENRFDGGIHAPAGGT